MEKNLLTLGSLTLNEIEVLLTEAEAFARGKEWYVPKQTFVANLFFEPSTRTSCSFEVAEKKLGLETVTLPISHSSVQKGEALYDTARTLQSIGMQALVIRHPEDRFYEQLQGLEIPVLNAGDGCGDHPTQSLLDLLTIKQEFATFQKLRVVIVGDLLHSRVARSNADVLKRLGAEVFVSGPKSWMGTFGEDFPYLTMDEAIMHADVLMLLRVQHERHGERDTFSKKAYHEQYGLTEAREQRMQPWSIIMHPAPVNRDVELAGSLVECERSRIYKQSENGVYVRMAVLQRAFI